MRQVDVVLFFKVEAFESAQERFVFDLVLRGNVKKIKKFEKFIKFLGKNGLNFMKLLNICHL